jgi:hypothetical protein
MTVVEREHREAGVGKAPGERVGAGLLRNPVAAGHHDAAAVGTGVVPGGERGVAGGEVDFEAG